MKLFWGVLAWVVAMMLQAGGAAAAQLDEYYLRQFGESNGGAIGKALLSSVAAGPSRCGTVLRHELARDWNKLETVTQKTLAKHLSRPVVIGEQSYTLPNGHFTIRYAPTGFDFPWVDTVAKTFEEVYAYYVQHGYKPAPVANTSIRKTYDVYLLDLGGTGTLGYTAVPLDDPAFAASVSGYPYAAASYIVLDRDFAYPGYDPLQFLQTTAAHEYQHAIQFGYNKAIDGWFAEVTSTWHEDELYDTVNLAYDYIDNWFFNSATTALDSFNRVLVLSLGSGYGHWLFDRYLAEHLTPNVVREAWERTATISSFNGNDVPMVPVLEKLLSDAPYRTDLGSEYFGFAKRVYQRNWTSHVEEISRIPQYQPLAGFDTYPVNAATSRSSISLPHYSFAYYQFVPSALVPTLTLHIARTSGIRTAVFKKSAGIITEIPAGPDGATYTVPGFSALAANYPDEVVLLAVNATNVDSHQVSFSTDGNNAAVVEPPNTPATMLLPAAAAPASGGGGGGCFIATAAYGSYLHPRVKLLRNFRDAYLLTNTPGRFFVSTYYRYSPAIAAVIERHEGLRMVTRLLLTPLVLCVAYPLAALSVVTGGGLLLVRRSLRRKGMRPDSTLLVVPAGEP